MIRTTLAWFFCILLAGCTAPLSTHETSKKSQLDDSTQDLITALEMCLNEKDWDRLHDLHWSGSELTRDSLRDAYEQRMKRIRGKLEVIDDFDFLEMNSKNFEQFMDKEELPGPAELLRGRIEFCMIGDQNENEDDYILVWAYLCKEDGKTKIFDYIELD